jgi:hypothetical protein
MKKEINNGKKFEVIWFEINEFRDMNKDVTWSAVCGEVSLMKLFSPLSFL